MPLKPKKDLNLIAKIEKAISEKYGEKAIQNPASFWNEEKEKEYLEQVKELESKKQEEYQYSEKVEKNGFFVSKKLINKEANRSCPVCDKYSFSLNDDLYLNKYDCCYECYVIYIEDREERWKKGWRPDNGRKQRT